MLDPKRLREDPKKVAEQLATRGFIFDVERWSDLEAERKQLQIETEKLQNERNIHSKKIGQLKAKGESAEETLALVAELGEKLDVAQKKLNEIKTVLLDITQQMPNIPHHTTPIGRNETENVEVRKWQAPKVFGFTPKDHVALGAQYLDFEAATRLSGARFVVLKGPLARLQRALAQFMLDLHTKEHGYEEVYVPYLVSSNTLYGTGQLPKAADDMFAVKDTDFWLIPTSEVAVTNLVSDQILNSAQLPLKYVCHSPCFRKEAGTYGKDMRGMLRQHQFEKVELVQVVLPEQSDDALESMVGHAEKILQALNLPYRVMALCTGDISFQSVKTYDLEVFLPGQNQYREISSCSNTEAFQARRMQARFRDPKTDKTEFVHTLNGSGIAVGRTLIAVMENYQDEQGRIHIPEVLWPYMGGLKII